MYATLVANDGGLMQGGLKRSVTHQLADKAHCKTRMVVGQYHAFDPPYGYWANVALVLAEPKAARRQRIAGLIIGMACLIVFNLFRCRVGDAPRH
ncbi:MAG: hypothetical protein QUS33_03275, partial [Dehalococcoidia bacterium]|nr:hypothetical protein [Dehalococcoidia bacterium]